MLLSAHETWSNLSTLADLIVPSAQTRDQFLEECRQGKLNGVVVTYRTFASYNITGNFDEELIAVLPESLKFICHNGKSGFTLVQCQLDLLRKRMGGEKKKKEVKTHQDAAEWEAFIDTNVTLQLEPPTSMLTVRKPILMSEQKQALATTKSTSQLARSEAFASPTYRPL
jgi:hypothetical protein